jgi:iron complex outermembrane receptor protein
MAAYPAASLNWAKKPRVIAAIGSSWEVEMSKKFLHALAVGCSLVPLTYAGAAFAQTDAGGASAEAGTESGEIIVTARRREESLQDVPVAVTAFTTETLRQKSIITQEDLVVHTPSLQIRSGGGQRTAAQFFIRGQGQTFSGQPSVVTYVNEVPGYEVPNAGNSAQFFDLENIQVLKGAQGTLFGRSTTGGAVLLTTKRPDDEIGGFLEFKFGNYKYGELTGALNIPIVEDKVLLRLAGNVVHRRGFTKSLVTGQNLDDKNREAYRATLLVRPIDEIENLTIFSGLHIDENTTGLVQASFNPNFLSGSPDVLSNPLRASFGPITGANGGRALYRPSGLPGAPFPLTLGYNQVVGGLCQAINPGPLAVNIPACISQRGGLIASLASALTAEQARVDGGGSIRRTAIGQEMFLRSISQQLTNITTVSPGELGPLGDITVKNIFATTRVGRSYSNRAVLGAPLAHANTFNGGDVINGAVVPSNVYTKRKFFDNFSNEFQISGSSRIADWLVGYYYNKNKVPANFGALFATFNDALDVSTPIGIGAIQGTFTFNERAIDKGLFGQVTVRPIPELGITAGYRKSKYSRTAQTATGRLTATGIAPNAITNAVPVDQSASSYNFSIDFKPTDNLLIYAAHRKGFKPGGANLPAAVPPPGFVATFEPETVKDYEVGLKYNYETGGVRGFVNLTYYHSEYSNVQRNEALASPGATTVFTQINNIAAAKIDGVEVEAQANIDRLRVGVTYSYTDARYTDYPGFSTLITETPKFDANGFPYYDRIANINSPYSGSPKHQFSINARYAVIDSPDVGEVAVSGNYYRQSKVVLDDSLIIDPNRIGLQKGYGTLNLRLEWNDVMGESFDLALNATNVTKEVYKVGVASLWEALGVIGAVYNEPRMISGELRLRF